MYYGWLLVILEFNLLIQRDNPVLNNEIWKDVQDLPYNVSNLGNVRRCPNSKYKYKNRNYVKPYTNHRGYLCINLYRNSKVHKFQIHRLVALAFVSNPLNKPVVNHKDGNQLNNSPTNLEWVTQSENCQHAWDTGLQKNRFTNASKKRKNSSSQYVGVSWSKQRNKWCVCIGFKGETIPLGRFTCEKQAAKAYDEYVNSNNLQQFGYATNFI